MPEQIRKPLKNNLIKNNNCRIFMSNIRFDALKAAGVQEGDVVKIGHLEFDYLF